MWHPEPEPSSSLQDCDNNCPQSASATMMLDNVSTGDHPSYLVAYAALLAVGHVLSHAFFRPSDAGGTLSAGAVAVNRHRYANKVVGAAHASVLSAIAARCFLVRGFDPRAERLLEMPAAEHLSVGFMLVYLAYDTSYMFWRVLILQPSLGVVERWTLGDHTLAVVHHALGLASWSLIYSGAGGVYWAQWIHVAEFSTPILNLRWILAKEGVRGSWYLAVSLFFGVVFFLCRIPTSSALLYCMYRGTDKWPSRGVAWFQFAVTFGFWCINVLWFLGGLRAISRDLERFKRPEKKEQ